MPNKTSLYEMQLGDYLVLGEMNMQILRVPGGWIFSSLTTANDCLPFGTVFVPFNNEFQEQPNDR